jgi:hypothetical protein
MRAFLFLITANKYFFGNENAKSKLQVSMNDSGRANQSRLLMTVA